MNLTNCFIAWQEGGEVELVPWPDVRNRQKFEYSWGACDVDVRGANFDQRVEMLNLKLVEIIKHDSVKPSVIQTALAELEEFSSLPS